MIGTLTAETLTYLVYAGAFLGVLLLFTGVVQLAARGESRSEARSRRMRMIAQGIQTEEILKLLKPAPAESGFASLRPIAGLSRMLRQAGMTVPVGQFVLMMVMLSAALSLGFAILVPPQVAVITGLIFGVGVPLIVLRARRKARLDKLVSQMPDALELMARALRVGHPLNTSIGNVAEEMPDPIGTEFGLIFDQISFGDDLTEAFREFSERIQIEDTQYLAASIAIQHGTGGDLARVISVLSKVIRDRMTMRRRIKAISSEGRLTGIFLSLLPVVIFGYTMLTSPTYYGDVMGEPLFRPMAIAVVLFTLGNYLVLRKLVNFRF